MKIKSYLLIIILWQSPIALPAYAIDEVHLYPGEKLKLLNPVSELLDMQGWTRVGKGVVYLLPVKKGEHLQIIFSSKSRFANLAIFDLSQTDNEEAIYSSDIDGAYYALTSKKDAKWLLRPYYPKAARRRGLGAPYKIHIQHIQ